MPKAKTEHKSKPVIKTTHKTFHKHVTEEPVTQSPEPTPQTTQLANETVITPVIQAEQKAEGAAPTVADDTTTNADKSSLTPAPENPQDPEQLASSSLNEEDDGKSKKPIMLIVIIIVVLLALATGYFLYTKKLKTESIKTQSTPIIQTSQSPESTTQILNQADWTLEVLNGSTKKGAAAALAEKLTAKGYQIIKTGNAPEDVATSQVFFADSNKDQADLFISDIKDDLPNPTNAGSLKDSTASARIIIGAE